MTHLHDNDGEKDLHLPPGEGKINWKGIKSFFDFNCSLFFEINSEDGNILKTWKNWVHISEKKFEKESNKNDFKFAQMKYLEGDLNEAIKLFKKVMVVSSFFWKTQAYIWIGKCFEEEGDFQKSLDIYMKVLSEYSSFLPERECIGVFTLPFLIYNRTYQGEKFGK